MPKKQSRIQKDITEAKLIFPKLKGHWNQNIRSWALQGDLDIFDDQGEYWNTFEIAVLIPKTYPYCVPVLIELSKKIPRDIDWHISQEGLCCVGIIHRLHKQAKRGIRIVHFLQNEVYPYFVNQLYKMETGEYVSGEYEHHFAGIRQFYREDLGLTDIGLVIDILKGILSNEIPGRNDLCFCRMQKFKKCIHHYNSVNYLKNLDRERLEKDIQGFTELMEMDH